MTTYTPPDKAPEGHKWPIDRGGPEGESHD